MVEGFSPDEALALRENELESEARVTRTSKSPYVAVGAAFLIAGMVACAVQITSSPSVRAQVLENMILVQDFDSMPPAVFREWSDKDNDEANMLAAFDTFLQESGFVDELQTIEQDEYKSRFVEDCTEQLKLMRARHGNPVSEWLSILRKSLEDEKPEVTEAFVKAINDKHLGFKVKTDAVMSNVSNRQVRNTLGTRVPEHLTETPIAPTRLRRLGASADAFDVRDKWPACKNVFDRAHNQGQCGSCWAFAAAQTLDSRLCIATAGEFSGPRAMLSRTYATSCIPGYNDGCQGGWPDVVFDLASQKGIPLGGSQGCIPYFGHGDGRDHFDVQGQAPPCPTQCKQSYGRSIHDDKYTFMAPSTHSSYYASNSQTEGVIRAEISDNGPVSAAVHVDNAFFAYESGVYNSGCQMQVNHAITVIGWGEFQGRKYWLIVNSWGAEDFGQMKVAPCVNQIFIVPGTINQPPRSVPEPLWPGQDGNEENDIPTDPDAAKFSVKSGDCKVDVDGCLSSPGFPNKYPANAKCEVTVSKHATLEVEDFNLEAGYDILTIDGKDEFSGADRPHMYGIKRSISWKSDEFIENTGFKVCLTSKPDPTVTYKAKCQDTGDDIAEPVGTRLAVECPKNCRKRGKRSGEVWGSTHYTRDSAVCKAGMHAVGDRSFTLVFADGSQLGTYTGSTQNGVTTMEYAFEWQDAFTVEAA